MSNIIDYAQRYGFLTGSTAYFGKGEDVDLVIDLTELDDHVRMGFNGARDLNMFMELMNNKKGPGYPDISAKLEDRGVTYNLIFPTSLARLDGWKRATRAIVRLVSDPAWKKLLQDKAMRCQLFEAIIHGDEAVAYTHGS